jgi:hypothetical protein
MSYLEQGCGEKKKVGGTREIFSKVKAPPPPKKLAFAFDHPILLKFVQSR